MKSIAKPSFIHPSPAAPPKLGQVHIGALWASKLLFFPLLCAHQKVTKLSFNGHVREGIGGLLFPFLPLGDGKNTGDMFPFTDSHWDVQPNSIRLQ